MLHFSKPVLIKKLIDLHFDGQRMSTFLAFKFAQESLIRESDYYSVRMRQQQNIKDYILFVVCQLSYQSQTETHYLAKTIYFAVALLQNTVFCAFLCFDSLMEVYFINIWCFRCLTGQIYWSPFCSVQIDFLNKTENKMFLLQCEF